MRGTPHHYRVDDAAVQFAVEGLRILTQKHGHPLIVNFAGNSEQTAPGIGVVAEHVVGQILDAFRPHTRTT